MTCRLVGNDGDQVLQKTPSYGRRARRVLSGSHLPEEIAMTITTAPHLSDQDVAAIKQLAGESVATVLAGDWDKWLAMFDDDIVIMPPGAPAVSGKADAKVFADEFPNITAFTFKVDDIEGRGDFAAVRGRYAWTLETDNGPQSDAGTWCCTCRHGEDGTWRMVWDIFNTDLPPA